MTEEHEDITEVETSEEKDSEQADLTETDSETTEEKISNIIHDQCSPVIIPEISFLNHDGKHIIKTLIYKGSNPPILYKK